VAPAGHAVSDHRREQRFDRAEQGEGKRVRQDGADEVEGEHRHMRHRQAARYAAKAGSDGTNVEAEKRGDD